MKRESRVLFPRLIRTDPRRKFRTEKHHEYLARSSQFASAQVRSLLNRWFSHLPENVRKDIKGRFWSKDIGNQPSAFFELYLHELLIRLEYSVTPYPGVSEGHPDFLVQSEAGNEFYVEAIDPICEPRNKRQAEYRRNVVLDEIDKLESPDFFLDIHSQGRISSPYPVEELKRELRRLRNWIKALNYDEIITQRNQGKRPQSFIISLNELTLYIEPLPKIRFRGKPGIQTLGCFSFGEAESDDNFLLGAILTKAKKYKKLAKPYIIAVNYLGWPLDRELVLDTFLGRKESRLPQNLSPDEEPMIVRPHPGIWRPDRYTRVSGVLLGVSIEPSKIADQGLQLFLNPFAKYPYTGPLTELPQGVVQRDRMNAMEWTSGNHPRSIFDLPKGWPLRRARKRKRK